MKLATRALIAGLFFVCAANAGEPEPTDAPQFSLGASYAYSSGTYGSAVSTNMQTLRNSASVTYQDITFDLSVPLVYASGDPNVIPGVGKVANTNPKKRGNGAALGSASGLGDITLSADYGFYDNLVHHFGFDVTASTKLATGSTGQGLGTGGTDFTLSTGAYQKIEDVLLTANVGYTLVGTSQYVRLKHSALVYSAGAQLKMEEDWSVGASLDGGERAVRASAVSATRELTGYIVYRVLPQLRLSVFGSKGLSNGSPDSACGASFTWTP